MTIKNGHLSKELLFYPPTQHSIECDLPLWVEDEEEDEFFSYNPLPDLHFRCCYTR